VSVTAAALPAEGDAASRDHAAVDSSRNAKAKDLAADINISALSDENEHRHYSMSLTSRIPTLLVR
jgi:hypothetical protein